MTTLGFTYLFTNNIEEMKLFYQSVLGLELIWDETDDIAFKIGDHQLSVTFHKEFVVPSAHFAIQPGWQGGTHPRTSWSIAYDASSFKNTVKKLSENRVKSYYRTPQWKGYWSYPVLDPMNNTIEITCSDSNCS